MSSIDQLNAQLAVLAAQEDTNLTNVSNAIARYQEMRNANNTTVLGNTVGETTNGITTLDQTIDPEAGQSTAAQTVSTTDQASLTPNWDPATVTSLGLAVDRSMTTTALGVELTGITPPKEPVNIVAIGGAAVDQVVSAVAESTDRKLSLMDNIVAVAKETSAAEGGLDPSFIKQTQQMKDKIQYSFADFDALDYFRTSIIYNNWQPQGLVGHFVHSSRLPKSTGFRSSRLLKVLPADILDPVVAGTFSIISNMPGLQGWEGQYFQIWVSEFEQGDPIVGANGVTLLTKSQQPNPLHVSWTHDIYYGQRDKETGEVDLTKKQSTIWMIPQDKGNLYLNFAIVGKPFGGFSWTPGDPQSGQVGEKEIDVIDYTFGFNQEFGYHRDTVYTPPKLLKPPSEEGMDSATRAVLTDISAIEEFAGQDAYNSAVATGVALSGTLTSTVDEVVGSLTDVASGNTGLLGGGLGGLIDDVVDGIGDFVGAIATDINAGFGAAQDLFEDLTGTATDALTSLLPGIGLAKETVSSVVSLITESQIFALRGDNLSANINLSKAAKTLLKEDTSFSPKMREAIAEAEGNSISALGDDIDKKAAAKGVSAIERQRAKTQVTSTESALKKLDASIAGQIVDKVGDFYTEDADLAELVQRYTGATTESFAYVDSREELEYEFIGMSRDVSEVILHATDTYTNANIGSEEIHLRHNDAGHNGIQYHYVIRRDGRLQRGMPIAETSDASAINGHKANCIDVALVGGVNVPTEADAPDQHLSASSYTQAQMKTLEQLLLAFYQVVPGGQVLGHNDIDIESPDPYFDVPSYVENLFGKKSVYENPLVDPSVSLSDLVNKESVS